MSYRRAFTISVLCTVVVIIGFLAGCDWWPSPGSQTKVSDAFFSVPTSFTGLSVGQAQVITVPRSTTSDSWVSSTVTAFYSIVREQVRFGAEVANSLKDLILKLELVQVGSVYLLDSTTNINHTDNLGRKYKWTTFGSGHFLLEEWAADGTKSIELDLIVASGAYSGSIVAQVSTLGWTAPATGKKFPDFIRADFDTNKAGTGDSWLKISLQGFRYHADLDPSTENSIIELRKNAAGEVTLGSSVRCPNSRHFVWDGYIKDAQNVETLNPSSASETRYYTAAGMASADNKATVYLGIPKAPLDATVFTGSAIGDLLKQLFTDRLNHDYDFNGTPGSTNDKGHDIITNLNNINAASNPPGVILDTAPNYNNTSQKVFDALQGASVTSAHAYDTIEYLVGVMSVTNPAYFVESAYQSYGSSVPAGFLTVSTPELLVPAQSDLDNMSLAFASNAPPGF